MAAGAGGTTSSTTSSSNTCAAQHERRHRERAGRARASKGSHFIILHRTHLTSCAGDEQYKAEESAEAAHGTTHQPQQTPRGSGCFSGPSRSPSSATRAQRPPLLNPRSACHMVATVWLWFGSATQAAGVSQPAFRPVLQHKQALPLCGATLPTPVHTSPHLLLRALRLDWAVLDDLPKALALLAVCSCACCCCSCCLWGGVLWGVEIAGVMPGKCGGAFALEAGRASEWEGETDRALLLRRFRVGNQCRVRRMAAAATSGKQVKGSACRRFPSRRCVFIPLKNM